VKAIAATRGVAWALALALALPATLRAEDKWYELYQGAL
jgi:hypothetical protein